MLILASFFDNLPFDQTALTLGMTGLTLFFSLISFVKGVLRTIFTVVKLILATAAFVFGYLQSPPFVEKFIPEASSWLPIVIGIVCALLILVLIQTFLGLLSGKGKAKSSSSNEGSSSSSSKNKRNFFSPIFGLLVGLAVLYGALTGIRYLGSQSELNFLQDQVSGEGKENASLPLLAQLNHWLEDSPIATWQERIDLLNKPEYRARLQLAKLVVLGGDEDKLSEALQDSGTKLALENQEVRDLVENNSTLREYCEKGDFQALLENRDFERLVSKPSIQRALKKATLAARAKGESKR